MSNILISPPPTTLLTGLLQLDGGVAISSTPVYVADQNNTDSKLALSTASVNINTLTGSALVNIKGTGTTNTTSPLTITNSAGTNTMQVLDNTNIIMGNAIKVGAGGSINGTAGYVTMINGGNSAWIGPETFFSNSGSWTANILGAPLFTLNGGSGYASINGNTGIGVTPTSRLHVKGSGSTSATTSLLVQNSAGTQGLKVLDDTTSYFGDSATTVNYVSQFYGSLNVYGWTSSGTIMNFPNASNSAITYANGPNALYLKSGMGNLIFQTNGANDRMTINSSGNVGIGTTSPSRKLTVNGIIASQLSDANDIQALLFANTTTVEIQATYGSTGSYVPMIFKTNNAERLRIDTSGNMGLGTSSISSRLQVQGSGTTSATSNLLLQNSSSTQLVKVTDDGKMTLGTGTTGTALLDVSVGAGSTPPLRLKGYSDAGTSYLISAGTESFADNFKVKMVNGNVTMGTQLNGYTFGLETFNGVAMHIANAGNIGMGTTSPNVSAKLDVSSTTQGFLPPRMTTAQKLAIGTPANGLMVFDTSLNQMSYYNGVTWINW